MNEKDREGSSKRQVDLPMTDVLKTVSDEVRMLSDTAGNLQNLVSNLIVAGAFSGSQSIYELQIMDRLCQNLGAVADFLNGLAKGAPPEWKVDVTGPLQAVKLADVCDRLTGGITDSEATTGDFEDFENWPMTG